MGLAEVICSRSVFGSTISLLGREFAKFGVETTFVSQTDVGEWRRAVRPTTKLLFAESPTNPLTEVCDIRALADIAHAAGALLAVDNCFCSPALSQPVTMGADLIIHSGTKYLDGQGRVIAGAICGTKKLIDEKFVPVMRSAGMTLSAFNAWVVLKGMETLSIRMKAQSDSALALATWLEAQPGVARVYYPGLKSHPQHALAQTLEAIDALPAGGARNASPADRVSIAPSSKRDTLASPALNPLVLKTPRSQATTRDAAPYLATGADVIRP